MKQIRLILALSLAVWLIPGCVEDPEMPDGIRNALQPEVTTVEYSDVTATSVTMSGEVKKENGAPAIVRGFLWGTKDPVTFENMEDSLHVSTRDTHFSAIVGGLTNNKKYYIAAFAENVAGRTMGEILTFTTNEGLGQMKTLDPTNVKAESALVGGKIEDPGEGQIKQRGVYYWKEGETKKESILSTMQTDSFTCQLTGLTPNTKYYVQAFATSQFGTIEGSSQKYFTTPTGLATFSSFTEVARDYTHADFKAVIAKEGDAEVTARGFCYSINPEPKVTNDTTLCESGIGEFLGRIKNLQANKKYYVRAYATNAYGVAYSENTLEVITLNDNPTVVTTSAAVGTVNGTIQVVGDVQDAGRSAITAAGVCWSTTSQNPTIDNDSYQSFTTALGVFNATISGIKGAQTYYVRTYASNSTNTAYGAVKTVTTPAIFKQAVAYTGGSLVAGSSGSLLIGNYAYLIGGDTGPAYTNLSWVYEPATGWSQIAVYPENMAWMTTVNYGMAAFSFGGRDSNNQLSNRFYSYSATNNAWTTETLVGDAPTAVARASGCALNLSVFYIGGIRKPAGTEVASKEVWRYLPFSVSLEKLTTEIPEPQYGGFSFVVNEVMYTGFGYTSTGISPARTKKLYRSADNSASSWSEETTFPGSASVVAAVVHKGLLYVVDDAGYIRSYNFTTKAWTQKSQLASVNTPVYYMYSIGDYIYINGVGNSKWQITYDPTWDN